MNEPAESSVFSMPNAGPPSLAVIMPALDARSHLPFVLPPLLEAQRAGDIAELWVVDDGSSDGTAEYCEAAGLSVLKTRGREGPGAARNLGVQHCRSQWVLFVDSDVVVPASLPRRMLAVVRGHPGCVAAFGSYDDAPAAPGLLSQSRNLLHHWTHQQAPGMAETFWAGCGVVLRQAFVEVGGFDVRQYPRPSIEDIELGSRLRSRGCIVLAADLQCTHRKRWRLWDLWSTDFFRRALPWCRLLRQRGGAGSLNASSRERGRAALSAVFLAALFLLLVLLLRPRWPEVSPSTVAMVAVGTMGAALGCALGDRSFLGLVSRRLGGRGVLVAFAMLRAYYLQAAIAWLWTSLFPRPRPGASAGAQGTPEGKREERAGTSDRR